MLLPQGVSIAWQPSPRVINVDKSPAYPAAIRELKTRRNVVEAVSDEAVPLREQHRGTGSSHGETQRATGNGMRLIPDRLENEQGIEAMHMINKGRVRWLSEANVLGQVKFISKLFSIAA
jgi:transposase, IS6 family